MNSIKKEQLLYNKQKLPTKSLRCPSVRKGNVTEGRPLNSRRRRVHWRNPSRRIWAPFDLSDTQIEAVSWIFLNFFSPVSFLINMRQHKHNNVKSSPLKCLQERQPLQKVVESALSGSALHRPCPNDPHKVILWKSRSKKFFSNKPPIAERTFDRLAALVTFVDGVTSQTSTAVPFPTLPPPLECALCVPSTYSFNMWQSHRDICPQRQEMWYNDASAAPTNYHLYVRIQGLYVLSILQKKKKVCWR